MRQLGGIVVGLLVCAAVALTAWTVYAMAGRALERVRDQVGGMDAPVSDDPTPVLFRVEPGQSATEIGRALEAQGLIRSARLFRLLVEREGVGERLAAGEYELRRSWSTSEIVAVLASGRVRRAAGFTVPEGWRAEEIAWKLDQQAPGAGARLLEIVYTGDAHRAALGLAPGDSLEGFLFPDTYDWRPDQPVDALVDQMVAQFLARFDTALRAAIAARGLSVRDAVTLASIVEREAAVPDERPLIAAVYLNRLARGMPLQADPTVQYALAAARVPAPGNVLWKRALAEADLEQPSPYNTYRSPGLPPGPICNPGLASLRAVAWPAPTDALYFVARGDGTHVFAQTGEEHLRNVERYRPTDAAP
ncbi:MAG TPA: endolytic transglycosylase MltG [Chloroflexota bacterium]|nr:endolytic transglycosylase MltG [Chloroflexota bacterium]